MSSYKDLLFLHGHIADPQLALELSAAQAADPGPAATNAVASAAAGTTNPNSNVNTQSAWREPMTLFKSLFKSLLYLGGLESIDSRIGEEEEAFGQTYGNRVASERTFGKPAPDPFRRRVVPIARKSSAPLGVVGGCA